ncbi:GlxA family transcriptional regulator [Peredibacter starrii]|uniref:Helix-turn-helix domain-containing protein n=1 Tax=Peredibacter starrii TaxID=28202 RepID=A0AAX4HK26_9BACT|nr:helix-turn-helix domain-containing protein [Peredibacter starrii]WPU63582.1 helix-turn-helix domain-containing protein [Peredibacter starrii]
MPRLKKHIAIGILLYPTATPTISLLMRDIFLTANQVLGKSYYDIELISVDGETFEFQDVAIKTKKANKNYDILLVSPYSRSSEDKAINEVISVIQSYYAKKTKIASPCLGSIILAQSGILKGKEATTHWAALDDAQKRFPDVKWNSKDMLCKTGTVTTAGGYLAAVDLILNLVSETSNKKTAHEIGRLLLAESSREKQSVYATSLISHKDETSTFYALESWIEKNISKDITVPMMSDFSNMSLRNFQRQFTEIHGVSPKGYLQLKRIEKAKALLRDTRLSVDLIVEKIGLSDVSSFRKLFQREVGMTPAEYRKRIK